MFRLFILLTATLVRALRAVLRSRSDLVLENLALRQQVQVLKRRRPRPQLEDADRAFWVAMKRTWRGWAGQLVLVQPETVVKWHRDRFRSYWTEISQHQRHPGRPRVDREVRELIRRMATRDSTTNCWNARHHQRTRTPRFTGANASVDY